MHSDVEKNQNRFCVRCAIVDVYQDILFILLIWKGVVTISEFENFSCLLYDLTMFDSWWVSFSGTVSIYDFIMDIVQEPFTVCEHGSIGVNAEQLWEIYSLCGVFLPSHNMTHIFFVLLCNVRYVSQSKSCACQLSVYKCDIDTLGVDIDVLEVICADRHAAFHDRLEEHNT